MRDFLQMHLQEPEICFGSQLTCFKRDPSCHIETPTSLFYKEVFEQKWYQERTTYHAWGVPRRVPSSATSRILCSDVASWAQTSRTPKIHGTSRPLGMTAAQRNDVPRDWLWDACHLARVLWGNRCKGFCSKEGPYEQSARNPLERDQVWKALGNYPEAVIGQVTINLQEFGNPLRIPYSSCTSGYSALLSGGLCHARK